MAAVLIRDPAWVGRFLQMAQHNVQELLTRVGIATCSMIVLAVVSPPAADRDDTTISSLALWAAYLGGLATVYAAAWVGDDVPHRRATGQFILFFALIPLAVATSLTGYYEIVLAVVSPEREV